MSGLFNVTAIVLFFSTGLHLTFIMALAMSFVTYPPGILVEISSFVENITSNLGVFFNIVVRLGAPLLIYAVIFNLIAGLVNKLTPQIPVYFVSAPFLICGGMVLLTWIGDDILLLFIHEVGQFINQSLRQ
jgi:flagellar biosynthetic protein FliR